MSHAASYGEGGCATTDESCKDELREAFAEYQEKGGKKSYNEWKTTARVAEGIFGRYGF